MKTLLKTILSAVIVVAPLAANAQVDMGNCHYGNKTVSEVTCFGPADLEGTTVTGTVKVFGPLTMNDAKVNDVTVMGAMHSSSSTVSGKTSVYGPLSASGTSFGKDVFSATNYLELSGSKISGNLTEKSSGESGVIKMTSGSSISGNVDFSAQSGIVKLDNSSKIGGSVINGTKQPIS